MSHLPKSHRAGLGCGRTLGGLGPPSGMVLLSLVGALQREAVGSCGCRKLCGPGPLLVPLRSVSCGQSPAAIRFPALPACGQGRWVPAAGSRGCFSLGVV